LTALLGVDRVGTPVLDETHRPDTFHIEPFCWQAVEAAVLSGEPSDALTTAHTTVALRRFRPAISASVFLSENIPAHLRSANVNSKVAEQRGPYLISGNWWDEKLWARAEWDLQLENGVLVRCHQSPPSLKLPPTPASARRAGVADVEKWEVDGVYD
jgi:protein ImuB